MKLFQYNEYLASTVGTGSYRAKYAPMRFYFFLLKNPFTS